jgi:ATP/maltotriose-dependent transcriptional regulator MalT
MNAGEELRRGTAFPSHVIDRPRLTQLLDRAEPQVVLLVAPAGYGKTTLARQWLASSQYEAVWYKAAQPSADVAVLASDIARAAANKLGIASKRIEQRLRRSASPDEEATELGTILAEDLRSWPEQTWLVLDDYQALSASGPAEAFVHSLVEQMSARVLIGSRDRPRWISARDVLYGNVFELGKNALAMTHGEAEAILGESSNGDRFSGLVALAEGWPAVIGLASLVPGSVESSSSDVPETLYDFFASELYHELTVEERTDICQLALAPTINSRLASELFGERSVDVLARAEARGFLTRHDTQYELHPLLRHFLSLKLAECNEALTKRAATTICQWEVTERRFSDALQLADRCGLTALVFEVIEAGFDDLLDQGAIASVEQWLEIARNHDPTSPTVSLAEMEVCFRRHRWDQARSHASRLIADLPDDHPHLSRALHRIGQIGHLDDRYEDAISYLTSARKTAKTARDVRAALWSQFLAVSDHGDREQARAILKEMKGVPDATVDDLLRLSQAELHLAARWGGVEAELSNQSGVLGLVEHSTDPLVRTGFFQTYGTALVLVANYGEALEIAERQILEAENSGLAWVTPHALELLGVARWGLRDFVRAGSSLRDAHRLSDERSDLHGQLNAAVLIARTHLAQGAPERALEVFAVEPNRAPGPSMQGDFLAVQGLAYACIGDRDRALDLFEGSQRCTDHIEARVVRSFIPAVLSALDGDEGSRTSALTTALREAHVTENYDAFVLAYRAHPGLLGAIATIHDKIAAACQDHIPVCDYPQAERAGLRFRVKHLSGNDPLTRREQEVLSLLQNGLSNREIAKTLWIAESTAKVHVRNLLRKLRARTRAEAVAVTAKR